jgi:hypothetical protein
MEVRGGALDAHADVARAADRAGLVEVTLTRLTSNSVITTMPAIALGERLDELEAGALDELDQALGDRLVIERVVDAVGGGGPADVGRRSRG